MNCERSAFTIEKCNFPIDRIGAITFSRHDQVVNYFEFRNNLTKSLNAASDNGEIAIVSRSKGKNVVIMSLEGYNSIQETLYLSSTKSNRLRLDEAIDEINKGKFEKHKLIYK